MPNNKPYETIHIRDLALRCVIGLNTEERRKQQAIIINMELFCDLRKACRTDRINDGVDYKLVKKNIIQLVEGSSFLLIEKLAEEIARLCLRFKGVNAVKITVDKPGALRYARSVAVEVFRTKNAS